MQAHGFAKTAALEKNYWLNDKKYIDPSWSLKTVYEPPCSSDRYVSDNGFNAGEISTITGLKCMESVNKHARCRW